MSLPKVVSRAEWLTARKQLLEQEKELTRRRDALSAERRRLPMVEIDKPYVFTGPDGEKSLLELFDGRTQLIRHAGRGRHHAPDHRHRRRWLELRPLGAARARRLARPLTPNTPGVDAC
jgi:hypothetical protein